MRPERLPAVTGRAPGTDAAQRLGALGPVCLVTPIAPSSPLSPFDPAPQHAPQQPANREQEVRSPIVLSASCVAELVSGRKVAARAPP